jgi:hypothetical protein
MSWFSSAQVGGAPWTCRAASRAFPTAAQGRRVPAEVDEGKGKRLVHFIGSGVAGGPVRIEVDLPDQQSLEFVLAGYGAPHPGIEIAVTEVRKPVPARSGSSPQVKTVRSGPPPAAASHSASLT